MNTSSRYIDGANLLFEILKLEGCKDIFGYPGGAVIPIFNALYDMKDINVYRVRHEQAAAHAAEGYGKQSSNLPVCLATSGPGATNLVTGIYNAYMDNNALFCITGQVTSTSLLKNAFQEANIIEIVKPIVKKAIQVKDIELLVASIVELVYLMYDKRHGPVLLDICRDVQVATIDYEHAIKQYKMAKKQFVHSKQNTNELDVIKVVEALKNSHKPVFLVGAGAHKANVLASVKKLSIHLKIPIVTSLHGLGSLADTPYYYGMAGMHGSFVANKILYNADFVLSIGSRYDDRLVGNVKQFAKDGIKVQIDNYFDELNRNINADIAIHADLSLFMKNFEKLNPFCDTSLWILQIRNWVTKSSDFGYSSLQEKIHPLDVFTIVNSSITKHFIFTTDVGQHQMWVAQLLKLTRANQLITSGGSGTMGFGLPSAIGASIAKPKDTIVTFVGDGGIQMTMEELIMIKQYDLNIKVIILNNQFLGMVRQWQELFFNKRYSSVEMDVMPNFKFIAKANDLKYLEVNNSEDLSKIPRYLKSKKACIININISREENVLPMIPSNQSFKEIYT